MRNSIRRMNGIVNIKLILYLYFFCIFGFFIRFIFLYQCCEYVCRCRYHDIYVNEFKMHLSDIGAHMLKRSINHLAWNIYE